MRRCRGSGPFKFMRLRTGFCSGNAGGEPARALGAPGILACSSMETWVHKKAGGSALVRFSYLRCHYWRTSSDRGPRPRTRCAYPGPGLECKGVLHSRVRAGNCRQTPRAAAACPRRSNIIGQRHKPSPRPARARVLHICSDGINRSQDYILSRQKQKGSRSGRLVHLAMTEGQWSGASCPET